MSTQWYYSRETNKLGPFTQQRLKEMAADGTVLPTDTVWLEGVEQGAPALQIKNLFPWLTEPAPVGARPDAGEPQPEAVLVADTPAPLAKAEAPKAAPKSVSRAPQRRAVAVKGAEMAGQDGTYARYRRMCITCGHKDSACQTIQINSRMVKDRYFCPKCRKLREVEIQCYL